MKRASGCWGLALLTGGLIAGTALAGPEDCGWRGRDCPRSDYSILHYWWPELYRARAYVHPSNLDQYPPGPSPSVAPSYEVNRYRCPSIPAMPSSPYADPAAYYGRSLTAPRIPAITP